jgi:hypothetical protein
MLRMGGAPVRDAIREASQLSASTAMDVIGPCACALLAA